MNENLLQTRFILNAISVAFLTCLCLCPIDCQTINTVKAQKSKHCQNSPSAISGSTVTLCSYENTFCTQRKKTTLFNNSSPLRWTLRLNHWWQMDYSDDVFHTFLGLDSVNYLAVNGTVTSLPVFIQNILNCVPKTNKAFLRVWNDMGVSE